MAAEKPAKSCGYFPIINSWKGLQDGKRTVVMLVWVFITFCTGVVILDPLQLVEQLVEHLGALIKTVLPESLASYLSSIPIPSGFGPLYVAVPLGIAFAVLVLGSLIKAGFQRRRLSQPRFESASNSESGHAEQLLDDRAAANRQAHVTSPNNLPPGLLEDLPLKVADMSNSGKLLIAETDRPAGLIQRVRTVEASHAAHSERILDIELA